MALGKVLSSTIKINPSKHSGTSNTSTGTTKYVTVDIGVKKRLVFANIHSYEGFGAGPAHKYYHLIEGSNDNITFEELSKKSGTTSSRDNTTEIVLVTKPYRYIRCTYFSEWSDSKYVSFWFIAI